VFAPRIRAAKARSRNSVPALDLFLGSRLFGAGACLLHPGLLFRDGRDAHRHRAADRLRLLSPAIPTVRSRVPFPDPASPLEIDFSLVFTSANAARQARARRRR